MAFVGHVLGGSNGINVLVIADGKCGENAKVCHEKMCLDDIKQWTRLDRYQEIKKRQRSLRMKEHDTLNDRKCRP